jgi:hypothetical protein
MKFINDISINKMQIFIRSDRTTVLDVEPKNTIKDIHQMIYERIHMPVDFQRLVYQCKNLTLNTDSTLEELDINSEATLHLYIKHSNK